MLPHYHNKQTILKDYDFDGLKFPAHKVAKEDDILDKFPQLGRIKSFKMYKGDWKTQVIKYIIFLYDKGSDLYDEIPDFRKRKEIAADLAGFSKQKGRPHGWSGPIGYAISANFDHEQGVGIFKMILAYLQLQNSYEWQELCILEQEYEEFTELRLSRIKDESDKDVLMAAEKKNKLRQASHEIIDKIREYHGIVFEDNEDVSGHVKHIKLTSPERFANKFK